MTESLSSSLSTCFESQLSSAQTHFDRVGRLRHCNEELEQQLADYLEMAGIEDWEGALDRPVGDCKKVLGVDEGLREIVVNLLKN